MSKNLFLGALLLLSSTAVQAQFATKVWAYSGTGAPAGYTDPNKALGPPSKLATPNVPDNSALVSLGNQGFIVLGFDRPIRRFRYRERRAGLEMRAYQFLVFGNAFYVGGNTNKRYQEPGIVEVGVDINHNGYDASDPFYRLKGSPNPAFAIGGIDETAAKTWGYADVTPTDGQGDPAVPDDPFQPGITPGSAGGDAFSLDWAVDADGNSVYLEQVDFVRIRSAGNGWSPEIDAVSLARPVPAAPYTSVYDRDRYGRNTAGQPDTELLCALLLPGLCYRQGNYAPGTESTRQEKAGVFQTQQFVSLLHSWQACSFPALYSLENRFDAGRLKDGRTFLPGTFSTRQTGDA